MWPQGKRVFTKIAQDSFNHAHANAVAPGILILCKCVLVHIVPQCKLDKLHKFRDLCSPCPSIVHPSVRSWCGVCTVDCEERGAEHRWWGKWAALASTATLLLLFLQQPHPPSSSSLATRLYCPHRILCPTVATRCCHLLGNQNAFKGSIANVKCSKALENN